MVVGRTGWPIKSLEGHKIPRDCLDILIECVVDWLGNYEFDPLTNRTKEPFSVDGFI